MNIEKISQVICPKRTLEIIEIICNHDEINFSEIEKKVNTSSDILDDRLKNLTKNNLINKNVKGHKDVSYSSTVKGQELIKKMEEIDGLLNGQTSSKLS